MKFILCLVLAVLAVSVRAMTHEEAFELLLVRSHQGKPTRKHFEAFKFYYGKTYSSEVEENFRFRQYRQHMEIAKANQDDELGNALHGATKLSDLTPGERHMRHNLQVDPTRYSSLPKAPIPKSAPASVDWRQHGAVTGVKDQGQCGSCWSFSTTGSVEGQYFLKYGQLISLSEQELVDCDNNGDYGCQGGDPLNAYAAAVKLGGFEREGDYKYTAQDGTCSFDKSKVAVQITGGVAVSSNEDDMAAWTAANGPLSICLNAGNMETYISGIADPGHKCNAKKIDHAVLLVGYDTDADGTPYWIIKNSWGTDWGENGYYRAKRGANVCGLDCCNSSATV